MQDKIRHIPLSPTIFSLRLWINCIDPKFLRKTFDSYLIETDYKVLNFSEYFFPVQGYTAIWLLAESHLAIHTFPDEGWTYVELSGCNLEKTEMFNSLLSNSSLEVKRETEQPSKSYPEHLLNK